MQILGLIIIGLIIGVLARLLLPGRQRIGVGMTLLLGIGGALVGGIVASALGTGDVFELNFLGAVVAIAAAAILILVIDRASAGRRGSSLGRSRSRSRSRR